MDQTPLNVFKYQNIYLQNRALTLFLLLMAKLAIRIF